MSKIIAFLLFVVIIVAGFYYFANKTEETLPLLQKIAYKNEQGAVQTIPESAIQNSTDQEVSHDIVPNTQTPFFYYGYSKLNEAQKYFYNILYDAVSKMQKNIVCEPYDQQSDTDLQIAFTALLCDRPEFYYLDDLQVTTKENFRYIELFYSLEFEEKEIQQEQLYSQIEQIIDVTKEKGYPQKEKYFYALLISGEKDGEDGAKTPFDALVNGEITSKGAAQAMQILCNKTGINCITVGGQTNGQEGYWNILEIGGEWYQTDVYTSMCGGKEYFNLSANDIYQNHAPYPEITKTNIIEKDVQYNFEIPICTAIFTENS